MNTIRTSPTGGAAGPHDRVPAPASASPRAWSVRDLAWLSVAAAAAGGLGEFVARLSLRGLSPYLDKTFYLDPQAIWMGPAVNVPIFAVMIAAISFLVRKPDRRARWATATAATLVILEVSLITRRIAPIALIALAVGIGVQLASLAMRWREQLRRALPVLAGALVVLSGALGAAWNIHVRRVESRGLAANAPPPPGAPNVLLLILDTVRAADLSAYGYHLPTTPALEQLAGDGIRFENAIATAPWTLPSHASVFTGRYPHELSVGWYAPLDRSAPTLAERLTHAGYATGGFVGNLIYTTYLYGLHRGFLHYTDYPLTFTEAVTSSTLGREILARWRALRHLERDPWHKDGREVTDEFLHWQERIGPRPFFAFLNYFDAHSPYQPPAPFDTMFLGRQPLTRVESFRAFPGADTIRDLRLAYDGGIRYVDSQVQRLLSTLEQRGVLRNTLVIVTGDHGEAFGEHHVLGHGSTVYLPQVHVPLVIALPGRRVRDSVIGEPVTLRDLAATILDVTGAGGAGLPGRSLARYWDPLVAHRDSAVPPSPILSEVDRLSEFQSWYPASRGDLQGILREGWHYVRNTNGEESLYRFPADTLEQQNLVRDPSHAATVDSLRTLLNDFRRP